MRGVFCIVTNHNEVVFDPEFMMSNLNEKQVKNVLFHEHMAGGRGVAVYYEVKSELYKFDFEFAELVCKKNKDDWNVYYSDGKDFSKFIDEPDWFGENEAKMADDFFDDFLQKRIVENKELLTDLPINLYLANGCIINSLH